MKSVKNYLYSSIIYWEYRQGVKYPEYDYTLQVLVLEDIREIFIPLYWSFNI